MSSVIVISDRNVENIGLSITGPAPSICYMREINPTVLSCFMCGLCISASKALLLTHFKNMGGVPERLTQFMFISKFIQTGNLYCPLSSPSQIFGE
jgi:hypothetical protein